MTIFEYTFTRRRIAESPAVVRSPSDTLPILRDLIGDRETERLAVLWLDTKLHVIGSEIVYVGNVSAALVRVGELFRGAVRVNATSIILAHNHPSGDPTPSPDDLHLTATALAAGRLLDIELLDHLILGEEGTFTSLRDLGIPFDRNPRTGRGDPTC
jgi:DNA repair protein RadC